MVYLILFKGRGYDKLEYVQIIHLELLGLNDDYDCRGVFFHFLL